MTTRRKILLGLGIGTLSAAIPTIAHQPTKVWRLGVLAESTRPPDQRAGGFGALVSAMRKLGYVEGKNLVVEWRFSETNDQRLLEAAGQLVRLEVDAIVVIGTISAIAARKTTTSIPIVMITVTDPVGSGLAMSLGKPGGNVTGLSMQSADIISKRLELLMAIVPKLSRVAVLMNRANPGNLIALKELQASAQNVGVTILPVDATTPEQLEQGFARMKMERAGAVIILSDATKTKYLLKIVELLAKYRFPSASQRNDYTKAGILLSYGHDAGDSFRLAATYVDKIFKGAKPADLPIQQPTKFNLVINGKTAKALGLTITPELLLRADEVIE